LEGVRLSLPHLAALRKGNAAANWSFSPHQSQNHHQLL